MMLIIQLCGQAGFKNIVLVFLYVHFTHMYIVLLLYIYYSGFMLRYLIPLVRKFVETVSVRKTDYGKRSFRYETAQVWNSLSTTLGK